MTTLNKADASLGKMQYHLKLKPGDVGKYVLLPGDPDRVFRISKYLDDVKEVVYHREYRTCTGSYKGIKISATSTGIGCPSAAIAVEELANVCATHFIRVGSTGELQPHINVNNNYHPPHLWCGIAIMSGVVVLGRSGIRDFLGIQAPPEFGISFPKSTIIRNMLSADAHHG